MSTISEIKSKYGVGTSDAGLSVVVDLAAMRSSAIDSMNEAIRMVDNQNHTARNSIDSDPEWTRRWKKRNVDSVKEQRRAIKTAQDMLADIVGILDKADAKLAEVK